MPNWCDNTLRVTHKDPKMIERLMDAFNDGRLCEEFIPIPEALKNTDSPNRVNADQLIEQTGYADWYDFCVNEWGTKWDVGGSDGYAESTQTSAQMSFQSAWAPPVGLYPVLESLGFAVEAMYYEPGCAFAGIYEDGNDECYSLEGSADSVEEQIPSELDEAFGIVESMRQFEEEDE